MDEKKELNPFDYVTIPVKEYKHLIKVKTRTQIKVAAKYQDHIKSLTEDKEMYRKWYYEEKEKVAVLEEQIKNLQGNLETVVEEQDHDGDN